MLIQLQTSWTRLRHFLSKVQVPRYELGQYSCDTGSETPRHVLLQCPYKAEHQETLREAQGGQLDLKSPLGTPKRAPIASKWMIRLGRILQFNLASELLYREDA